MKMTSDNTLMLDADIIAYQAAAGAEKAVDWGDGLWTLYADEVDAQSIFQDTLLRLTDKWDGNVVLAFSSSDNFRKKVDHTYKGNRKDVRKPMVLKAIKDWASEEWDTLVIPNLEADDVLGIYVTSGKATIWSADKDLKTCYGKHWVDNGVIEITESEADYWFYYQTLTGDTTDGYAGCPKVGPKTAEKILKDDKHPEKSMWDKVVDAFDKAGLGVDEAIKQARLARILRYTDYDKEVILWTP